MHLVDMLPSILLNLTFQSAVPGLTRAPEVYAAWPRSRTDLLDFSHVPPLQSNQRVMHVLHEEIVKNAHGTTDRAKAIQPTWVLSMANVSTIGVKAAEVGAGNGPSTSQHTSHSPVACASHSPVAHATHSPVRHRQDLLLRFDVQKVPVRAHLPQAPVPGWGVCQAPAARNHHSWAPVMSHAGSPAGSRTGSQASSEGSGSSGSERSRSTSPEVVLVQDEDTAAGGEDTGHSEDDEALSQGTVSLLDISNSDNEEACKAAAHETVHKSDVQYGAWQDEQIHQGNEGIAQHDKQVDHYADAGRPNKALDKIGPPLSYMEEHGVFKPLDGSEVCSQHSQNQALVGVSQRTGMASHYRGL